MQTRIDVDINTNSCNIDINPSRQEIDFEIINNQPLLTDLYIDTQTNNVEFDIANPNIPDMTISDVVVHGPAAGFGTVTASAEAAATPWASVLTSGPDTAKNFAFRFGIPNGSGTVQVSDVRVNGATIVANYIANLLVNDAYGQNNPIATLNSITTDNLLQGSETFIINGGGPSE